MKMKQKDIELLIVALPPKECSSIGDLGNKFRRYVMKCIKFEFRRIQMAKNDKYPFDLQFRCMHKEPVLQGSCNTKKVEEVWNIKSRCFVNENIRSCLDQSSHCIDVSSVFGEWFQQKPDPKQLQYNDIYVNMKDLDCISKTICENFDESSANDLAKHLYVTPTVRNQQDYAFLTVYDILHTWIIKPPSKSMFDVRLQALYDCDKVHVDFDEVRNFMDDKGKQYKHYV